jgi:hypothetical protein
LLESLLDDASMLLGYLVARRSSLGEAHQGPEPVGSQLPRVSIGGRELLRLELRPLPVALLPQLVVIALGVRSLPPSTLAADQGLAILGPVLFGDPAHDTRPTESIAEGIDLALRARWAELHS